MPSHRLPDLILASSSPRRRELLALLGIPFRILEPQTDETPVADEPARDYALRVATDKARHVYGGLPAKEQEESVVLAADTVVSIDGHILGKPRDEADAESMLCALSGRTHQVFTGMAMLGHAQTFAACVATDVDVKPLTPEEVGAYVATGEPMDKAGAYAIQGRAAFMVRALRGSYTNVVGLPLAELEEALTNRFGLQPFAS